MVADTAADARALIEAALARLGQVFVRVDAAATSEIGDWLESIGLRQVGDATTMVKGPEIPSAGPARMFALANQSFNWETSRCCAGGRRNRRHEAHLLLAGHLGALPQRHRGPGAGHCDVAVIGGGLTGCSAALALAKKGARVVLLEAETIGHAASGRNGGMCNNGFAQDYGLLSAKLGKDVADRLYRAFDAGVDTVERLVARREDRLQLRARRQDQARGQARALRQAGAQPGTAGRQCRSRHGDGEPCSPGRRGRLGPLSTAG